MAVTKASAKFIKVSPRKMRQVVDLIRGKGVAAAEDVLAGLNKKPAQIVNKVLQSAVANAEHNNSLDRKDLYISKIYTDQGPALKRFRAGSMGRASMIKKRTAHVSLELDIKAAPKTKVQAKAKVESKTKAKTKAKGGKK